MADNVSITVAEYLKSEALFASVASPSGVAWAGRAVESQIISPLYFGDDAAAEATRQAAFLAGPLVEDVLIIPGQRKDLFLKAITADGDKLGYSGGKPCFVIGFNERDDGHTELTVVRSLAA